MVVIAIIIKLILWWKEPTITITCGKNSIFFLLNNHNISYLSISKIITIIITLFFFLYFLSHIFLLYDLICYNKLNYSSYLQHQRIFRNSLNYGIPTSKFFVKLPNTDNVLKKNLDLNGKNENILMISLHKIYIYLIK